MYGVYFYCGIECGTKFRSGKTTRLVELLPNVTVENREKLLIVTSWSCTHSVLLAMFHTGHI